MNEDTKNLLKECCSGCQMAVNSMNQLQDYVQDQELDSIIHASKNKHEQLKEKAGELLLEEGYGEKTPKPAAAAFSWISTEMKMLLKNDDKEAAKILMDGCNMGITSVSHYQNEYGDAGHQAKQIASELVGEEEGLMKKLEKYL